MGPTYFEIVTAMALVYFAEERTDVAVLEVGLGGRLDSTNVCQPAVSVITSISFDHTKQLGDTLEAIAWEKAGIIKPGVPVVSGVTEPGPRDVIRGVCDERGCRLMELGREFGFQYRPPHDLEKAPQAGILDFSYRSGDETLAYRELALGLLGRHQGANAAVALATLAELRHQGWSVPEAAIRKGLAELTWPARIELIARRPAIVIDAAHNLASVEALVRVLNESFAARRRVLVFATTLDKDIGRMLECLLPQFDDVVLTRYLDNPRAVPVEDLAAIAREVTDRAFRIFPGPAEAWDAVRRDLAPDDLVCVTGSFFIAGQMRQQIRARPVAER
jgi:dihydrofolate synthase/folylpolyglutamate synthase